MAHIPDLRTEKGEEEGEAARSRKYSGNPPFLCLFSGALFLFCRAVAILRGDSEDRARGGNTELQVNRSLILDSDLCSICFHTRPILSIN